MCVCVCFLRPVTLNKTVRNCASNFFNCFFLNVYLALSFFIIFLFKMQAYCHENICLFVAQKPQRPFGWPSLPSLALRCLLKRKGWKQARKVVDRHTYSSVHNTRTRTMQHSVSEEIVIRSSSPPTLTPSAFLVFFLTTGQTGKQSASRWSPLSCRKKRHKERNLFIT